MIFNVVFFIYLWCSGMCFRFVCVSVYVPVCLVFVRGRFVSVLTTSMFSHFSIIKKKYRRNTTTWPGRNEEDK